jgi:hypothetical protein
MFGEDCMEFHLTYFGQLLGEAGPKHKHEIRRTFHPQLKRLWEVSPYLKSLREPLMKETLTINRPPDVTRLEALPRRFQCGPFGLVPLVTRDLKIACSLEILFLRPDYPGGMIRSGDIDNRLKTLFDALRIPGPDTNELGGCTPEEGESPLYCLLEDDSLITEMAVKTDVLLEPTSGTRNARLVITTKIKPIETTVANLGFR